MVKTSKYNRNRGINQKKEETFVSKLPAMDERAFLVWKYAGLIPEIANLIAEYAVPNYREIIEHFSKNVATTVGDLVGMRDIIENSNGTIKFARHRGRKPGKKEFYAKPKTEFYIIVHTSERVMECFYITVENFITSLETGFWFLPDNRKVPISVILMEAIKKWMRGIMYF